MYCDLKLPSKTECVSVAFDNRKKNTLKALDAGGRGTGCRGVQVELACLKGGLLMYSRTVSRSTDVTVLLHYMAKWDMEKSGNGSRTAVPG